MKKIIFAIIFLILFPAYAIATGSVTQSLARVSSTWGTPQMVTLTFTCIGDAANGSIPDTAISDANIALLKGFYLYAVAAYPTSGGTAPDAADVTVIDAGGADLLGGKGVNLIHATNKQATLPYNTFNSSFWYPAVTEGLTVKVANQDTASADYTLELIFVR